MALFVAFSIFRDPRVFVKVVGHDRLTGFVDVNTPTVCSRGWCSLAKASSVALLFDCALNASRP